MVTEGQVKDVSFRLGWMSSQPEDQRKNRFQKMDDAPLSAGQRGGAGSALCQDPVVSITV